MAACGAVGRGFESLWARYINLIEDYSKWLYISDPYTLSLILCCPILIENELRYFMVSKMYSLKAIIFMAEKP